MVEEIAIRLRQERKRRCWTQEQVAQQLGTTAPNVSRWERGKTFPDVYYRQKLCGLFGRTAEELGFLYDEAMDTKESVGSQIEEKGAKELLISQIEEQNTKEPVVSPVEEKNITVYHLSWRGLRHKRWIGLLVLLLVLSGSLVAMGGPWAHGLQIVIKATKTQVNKKEVKDWYPKGHILSRTYVTKDGLPSLEVTLSSRRNSDCPYVARILSASDHLHAGQTVHLSLYVPKGPVIMAAHVFAMDVNYQWYSDLSMVTLPQGVWYTLDYVLPSSFTSPATQVGVQFASHPLNMAGTVYVGTLGWS